jgi:glycosyltransferase involved in cell wall biosynthesis
VRIVFDNVVFSLQRGGGVSRFWSKIIEPYVNDSQSLFVERTGTENIYRRHIAIQNVLSDHRLPLMWSRYLNFRRKFFDSAFVFHSSYFRINAVSGCENVTTVHDLMYEKFGSGIGRDLHVRQKKRALRNASAIVCVSEHTRSDLLEQYDFCNSKRILVIPNGVDGFHPTPYEEAFFRRFGLEDRHPYFLYVGSRGTCKGFHLIHDALEICGHMSCVVVGEPFTTDENISVEKHGHTKKVINVGKIDDSDLNRLYGQARFLFFPSLYEGFGIPPLEALLAGCPVVASNKASIPRFCLIPQMPLVSSMHVVRSWAMKF